MRRALMVAAVLVGVGTTFFLYGQPPRPPMGGPGMGQGMWGGMQMGGVIGKVVDVKGSQLKVSTPQGQTVRVVVDEKATVQRHAVGSKADIKNKAFAEVVGETVKGSFQAKQVVLSSSPQSSPFGMCMGQVMNVRGGGGQFSISVSLSKNAKVFKVTDIKPKDIRKNEEIMANGRRNPDGSIQAFNVGVGAMRERMKAMQEMMQGMMGGMGGGMPMGPPPGMGR